MKLHEKANMSDLANAVIVAIVDAIGSEHLLQYIPVEFQIEPDELVSYLPEVLEAQALMEVMLLGWLRSLIEDMEIAD